jgi:hypothetical protein
MMLSFHDQEEDRMSILTTSIQYRIVVTIRQEKGHSDWKERSKPSFTDDIILNSANQIPLKNY